MQIDNILGHSPRTYMMNHGGIYVIRNIISDCVYIGQTTSFYLRIGGHVTALRNNKHKTPMLQSDWNTHGADNFKFEVLIAFRQSLFARGYIEREQLSDLEIEYWQQYQHNCY